MKVEICVPSRFSDGNDLPPAVRPPCQFAHADKSIGVTVRRAIGGQGIVYEPHPVPPWG
jgi:hypothetical protein